MEKKFRIRRAILSAMHLYFSPQSIDSVSANDGVMMTEAEPAELRKEWNNLIENGYIVPVEGYGTKFCSLHARIRKKLDEGWAMNNDEFLFGVGGIR